MPIGMSKNGWIANQTGKKLAFQQANSFASATGGYLFFSDDENGDTYAYHYFKISGTSSFEVETGGSFDFLIVAGGGGGGSDGDSGGGGGGAGGMTFHTQILSPGTYEVVVGNGGVGVTGIRKIGNDGATSSFFGIDVVGGGGGGGGAGSSNQPGRTGGSGGGAAGNFGGTTGVGGLGITGQGNKGGSGKISTPRAGGGGGGAGGTGRDGGEALPSGSAGGGGEGIQWLDGRRYAGGGGQAYRSGFGLYGGKGGGGVGSYFERTGSNFHITYGYPSTGGGGGGGGYNFVTQGGSGIVALRYRTQNRNLPIPSDGLVFFLDAGNTESYSGSGSSWYDLSGNGYHATLVNSPGFTANSGGGIVFNGSNQYATISNPSPHVDFSEYQSVFMILKPSAFSVRRSAIGFGTSVEYSNGGAISVETNGTLNYYAGLNTSVWNALASVSALTLNQTKILCAVRNQVDSQKRWYFNGATASSGNAGGIRHMRTVNSTTDFYVGDGYLSPFAGTIYTVAVYNKPLTYSQVSDMYNYFNTRHGL